MRHRGNLGLQSRTLTLCAAALLFATGCRHQPVRTQLPLDHTPVELESIPETQPPALIETPPEQEGEAPIAAAAASPRRERRRSVRSPAGTPGSAAPAPAPEEPAENGADNGGEDSLIGDLTTGGESTPESRQEAQSLLKDNDHRLRALPESVQHSQRSQVNKVRNFQRQAQRALTSGDSEGARTLATKAKLLLDDLGAL